MMMMLEEGCRIIAGAARLWRLAQARPDYQPRASFHAAVYLIDDFKYRVTSAALLRLAA